MSQVGPREGRRLSRPHSKLVTHPNSQVRLLASPGSQTKSPEAWVLVLISCEGSRKVLGVSVSPFVKPAYEEAIGLKGWKGSEAWTTRWGGGG